MTTTENLMRSKPDISISVNQAFGFDTDLHVEGFSKKSEYVPEIDSNYCFDKATTMAIPVSYTHLTLPTKNEV